MDLTLKVDAHRLLKEIPAFFQSFQESLTEVVQNAYRAGARHIAIRLDHDAKVLTVKDDGPGAANPETLFTAGATGWTNTLVDPAGLGLFALLGLSQEVVVESCTAEGAHWRATLTAACFAGAPITCETLPATAESGLRITAHLKEEVGTDVWVRDARLQRVAAFRQHYPIEVELIEIRDGKPSIYNLARPQLGDVWVETPVGRLYLTYRAPRSELNDRPRVTLIMEHREMAAHNAWDALAEALEQLPQGHTVTVALSGDFTLIVDPATGLRPKLPDRREPIQDAAYKATMARLAQSLYDLFDPPARLREIEALSLPDAMRARKVPREAIEQAVQLAPVFERRADNILMLGYRVVTWDSIDNWHFRDYGYESEIEIGSEIAFARQPLLVQDASLICALCDEDIYAQHDAAGEQVRVRIVTPRLTANNIPFGVCERIEVLGADGRLIASPSRLCLTSDTEMGSVTLDPAPEEWTNEEAEELPSLYIVCATREEGLGRVRSDKSLLGYVAYRLGEEESLGEFVSDGYDGEDADLNWVAVRELMEEDYLQDVLPEAKPVPAKPDARPALRRRIQGVQDNARAALGLLDRVLQEQPEKAALVGRLQRALDMIASTDLSAADEL